MTLSEAVLPVGPYRVHRLRWALPPLRNGTVSTIAHLTLADYDRMIDAGVFDQPQGRRLEFIRGEIREMNPIGSRHEVIVDRLNEWSLGILPRGRVWVRVQNSISLPGLESAPEPDLVWVARRDYSAGRPTAEDVQLLVEVADTTLAYDAGEKAELYAAAGIADYWVVDIPGRAIEVRRDPVGGRYRSLKTHTGEEELHPLAFPEVALRPSTLWQSP
jgi:Uma2 family endonuclease